MREPERQTSAAREAAHGPRARVRVIGRRPDLAALGARGQGDVLDVPDEQWSESLNRAWIQEGVAARQVFLVISRPSPENLWCVSGTVPRKTVFALELEQLRAAGYVQAGEYWFPPTDGQGRG